MVNALVINEKDNVCIAIEKINKGMNIVYMDLQGKEQSIIAKEDIHIYHKVAIKDIKKDGYAIKYGEHIGVALKDIIKGEHVHEHNIEGRREDLEHIS